MLKRLLTGIGYLAVLAVFFLLKIYVVSELFDILILAFTGFGAYEMLRAFGEKICTAQKAIAFAFSLLVVITYAVCDIVFTRAATGLPNYAMFITFLVFLLGVGCLLGALVFWHENVSLQSTGYACLCLLYPSLFTLALTVCNHFPHYSELAILFVFIVCPFSDSLAFVFGKLFGKILPFKMSPTVSPNKTVIGGVGGLVGGALGAFLIFLIHYGLLAPEATEYRWIDLTFFVGIGILTAAFTEFGDLVESAVKRKLEIKDMGKILPGHGGVLDRIDSALYASVVVCLAFFILNCIMV